MKTIYCIWNRRLVVLWVLCISIALSLVVTVRAEEGPSLALVAPAQVEVGDPIEIDLVVHQARALSAYEVALRYDRSVAEFGGLEQRENDLSRSGRAVKPFVVSELTDGVAFGLYSCSVPNCDEEEQKSRQIESPRSVKLATVTIYAKEPGKLEISLGAVKFVDFTGELIDVTTNQPTIVVQVGSPADDAIHSAPPASWTLTPRLPAQQPGPFDLTRDGRITLADVVEVELDWQLSRLDGMACGQFVQPSRDINHDGCIDVADMQLLASHVGIGSTTSSSFQLHLPQIQNPGTSAPTSDAEAETPVPRAVNSTFVVNVLADMVDANPGDGVCATNGGYCSLRAAIEEANATPGPNTIEFNIWGSGTRTIQLTWRLPALSDTSGPTTIDGYTQPGAQLNSDPSVSNAVMLIEIAGNGENGFDGIPITSPGNRIRGLSLYKLRRSFWIYGSGASGNVLGGNFIGTNSAGTYGAPALGHEVAHGIHVEQGANGNLIGGLLASQRNVISGNGRHGIGFWHAETDGNQVINNLVGLSPDGLRSLPNRKHGLDLNFGASENRFEKNVVSGNDDTGIEISHTANTTANEIVGNYIGTDTTGTRAPAALKNGFTGITIEDGASFNTISGNVIGNNSAGGIRISYGAVCIGNQIYGNRIGISLDNTPIANGDYGILANGVSTRIGPGNIVAFNTYAGIKISENNKDFNTITQNSIYNNGAFGIELYPYGPNVNDPNDTDSGPNEQLNYPVIQGATPQQVTGTACANCIVEVFVADSGAGNYGEGKTFVGSVTANGSGAFVVSVNGVQLGDAVTTTATDPTGNTSEFSLNVVVTNGTPPPTPTPTPTATPGPPTLNHAADSFSRTMSNGWGMADVGGSYTLLWGADAPQNFGVNGTEGMVLQTVGGTNNGREAILEAVSVQDVDISLRIKTDQAPANSQDVLVLARRVNSGTMYRGRIRFESSGQIRLQADKASNSVWSSFVGVTTVPGVTYSPNTYVWLRVQVAGTNPTTIRMKAWANGQSEPSGWQYTVTDSDPNLQRAGAIGLRMVAPSAGATVPVYFTVDDLLANPVPASVAASRIVEDSPTVPMSSEGSAIYLPAVQR